MIIEPFIDCFIRFQIMKRIINWFVLVSGKEHLGNSPEGFYGKDTEGIIPECKEEFKKKNS